MSSLALLEQSGALTETALELPADITRDEYEALGAMLPTMKVSGGNTDELYTMDQKWGRWYMARSLEVMWPDVVTVERRFNRTQHVVDWRRFRQPLIRREDVDFDSLPKVDEYGLKMVEVGEAKDQTTLRLLDAYREREAVAP